MSLKSIVLAAALFFSALSPAYAGPTAAPHFHSEQEAKQHCPHDSIVWVNTKTGVYHLKGERWYGATKDGAYVCRKEADAEVIVSPGMASDGANIVSTSFKPCPALMGAWAGLPRRS